MKRKNLTSELVTRELNSGYFKYMGLLPNPDKVLRKTGNSVDAYRELKNDPHVWSCIQSRKSGILSLDTYFEAGDSRIAEFIEEIFADIDLYNLMRDILEAPLFGNQPLEVIWRKAGGGRYLIPDRITAKPQEWFFYDNEGILNYKTGVAGKGKPVPEFKMLMPRYEPSYLNPYGQALLGKCYWPVTFKNGGMRYWVNFTEKYGMPILIAKYERGSTQKEVEELADALVDMSEDSVIVTPIDINIELSEPQRSSSSALFSELIKYCNAEISKAILSQTLTTEIDMGSYAAAQTHYKVRREVILADLMLVERTVNELIRWIAELNFGSIKTPRFRIKLEEEDKEEG